jgi:adenosylhomocysteine nucleosidase
VSKPVAVVCGLAAEGRIARGSDARVVVGGGDAERLRDELAALLPEVCGILSFGVAGGLRLGLTAGTVRVAQAVVDPEGRRYLADENWSSALSARLAAPKALFAGVTAPLAGVAGKAALNRHTGAELVDMESHHAAALAAKAGLPFTAVRVVTDAADRELPHAATVGMRADGSLDLRAILRSLAGSPRQLPGLIRTGLEARAAFASLLRCRQLLGPGFALLDLGKPLLHVP